MFRIRDLRGIWRPRIEPVRLHRRWRQETSAHLQEGPTAKTKARAEGQARRRGPFFFGCGVTTAGAVCGTVAQGQGQPDRVGWGDHSSQIVFTPQERRTSVEMLNEAAVDLTSY